MSGQNGAMVLIIIDGHVVSRIAYEVMHSFTCALPIQLHVLHTITLTEVTGPARPAGPQGARGPKGSAGSESGQSSYTYYTRLH